MSMRWQDAAFEQEYLLHAMDHYFGSQLDAFQESAMPNRPEYMLRRVHKETLTRADPIYVSDDVMSMWEYASESFRMEPLRRSDLTIPCGFALLPRPFHMKDVNGIGIDFRAISWLPVSLRETQQWDEGVEGQGVFLSLYSHINDRDEHWERSQSDYTAAKGDGWRWMLMHATTMLFDNQDWYKDNYTPAENEKIAEWWTIIHSFWRLMAQIAPAKTQLHRQARRSRRRAGLVEDVTVMRLRRQSAPNYLDEGEGGRDYSHRWIRSGHWRKQPYGPRDNPSYQQIWIAPHVCGPEDKPLIVKKRVVEFTI